MINDAVYNEIISIIEDTMIDLNLECAGSEMILYAIASLKDSMTSLILNEYALSNQDILKTIKEFSFLRKYDLYTSKFYEVIALATKLMEKYDYVYDEAYLLSILEVEDNVAKDILRHLRISEKIIYEELEHASELLENDSQLLVNITKLAKEHKLSLFIGREDVLDKIDRILSRKQKNNPMLIGEAGVGKSGLVEGLAQYYLQKDPKKVIYRLDLGFLIAGTRYRGDLEEKLMDAIKELKHPNKIVFIDEIHNIMAGNSNEASLDVANMLKPVLSRSEIKCIGATTTDEYYRYIAKDKALVRRFHNVFINEASDAECLEILKGIKNTYEEYYQCQYSIEVLKYIISASKYITYRHLPDKAIDLLDEAGLLAKRNGLEKVSQEIVRQLIFEELGLNIHKIIKNLDNIENEDLKKHIYAYVNLNSFKNIVNIETLNKEKVLQQLQEIFNFKEEIILEIDLEDYLEQHYLSNLTGSPKGYVGYEDGGLMSEHIIKHLFSIIVIKNYVIANKIVLDKIVRSIKNNYLIDSKNRKISLKNTIFIFVKSKEKENIGFINHYRMQSNLEIVNIIL